MPYKQILKSRKTYSRRNPVALTGAWEELMLLEHKSKKEAKMRKNPKGEESSSSFDFDSDDLKLATATPPSSRSTQSEDDEEKTNRPRGLRADQLKRDTSSALFRSPSKSPVDEESGAAFQKKSSEKKGATACRGRSWPPIKSKPRRRGCDRLMQYMSEGLADSDCALIHNYDPDLGGRSETALVQKKKNRISAAMPTKELVTVDRREEVEEEGLMPSSCQLASKEEGSVPQSADLFERSHEDEESEETERVKTLTNSERKLRSTLASETMSAGVTLLNTTCSRSTLNSKSRFSARKTMMPRFTCEEEEARPETPLVTTPSLLSPFEFSFLAVCDHNTARQQVLDVCGQKEPKRFESFFSKTELNTCKKIGEGTFGEVFSIRKEGRLVAVKVMPVEGDYLVNGEKQKSFAEVLSELMVTRALSNLQNGIEHCCSTFMEVFGIHCILGKYPKRMRDEWHKYDRKNKSENDPIILEKEQLFIALVTEHCGSDLEKLKITQPNQVLSIVWQLCFSLAVAENELQFEHRDLHLGNILVKETSERTLSFRLNGINHSVPTYGIKVSVIDYSLSRVTLNGYIFYVNLESERELFDGTGNAQYDVYRTMREINGNKWRYFCSSTNIVWLGFVCSKLIDGKEWPKNHRQRLKDLEGQIERSSSALEMVKTNFVEGEFRRKRTF